MASISAMAWSPCLSSRASTPCASLTFLTGSTARKSSVSLRGGAAVRSPLLWCSGLVVRVGKAAPCLTKRSRSRKSLARTHGFRRRMRTTGGRAMMKRRHTTGRKVLCTKSNPSSGKRA
ncbi:unnamed protein product [Malus baccata var. baccata]